MRSPIYPHPHHRHRPCAFALILPTLVVSTLVLLATPLLTLLLAPLLILLVIAIMALGARRGHHRAGSRRSPCCVCRDPPRDTGESGCDCRWGVHLHHPQVSAPHLASTTPSSPLALLLSQPHPPCHSPPPSRLSAPSLATARPFGVSPRARASSRWSMRTTRTPTRPLRCLIRCLPHILPSAARGLFFSATTISDIALALSADLNTKRQTGSL